MEADEEVGDSKQTRYDDGEIMNTDNFNPVIEKSRLSLNYSDDKLNAKISNMEQTMRDHS